MLKRQKEKRQKKMTRRRKAMPKRNSQQEGSPQQLEQLLKTLPTLAFEPELTDLNMGEEKLRTLLESEQTEIEIILELLTEEFIADLDQRLEQLESTHSKKSIKSVLAKATRHQIANSDKIQYLSNPVLIALFLKTRSEVEEEKLDLNSLPAAMEEFDKRNLDFIQELTKQMEGSEKDDSIIEADGELLDEEKPEKRTPAIETDVYNKFMELVPAEKQEQMEEDLEVFLVDFEPPPISVWDSELIKNFLDKWFLENANPLEEDLVSMRESLLSLFNFLAKEDLLPDGFLNTVTKSIQNS
jgi:hypothetical protein